MKVTIRVPGRSSATIEAWRYAAVVLGQEGFPASGVMRVRDVQPTAEQWRFGGARRKHEPHARHLGSGRKRGSRKPVVSSRRYRRPNPTSPPAISPLCRCSRSAGGGLTGHSDLSGLYSRISQYASGCISSPAPSSFRPPVRLVVLDGEISSSCIVVGPKKECSTPCHRSESCGAGEPSSPRAARNWRGPSAHVAGVSPLLHPSSASAGRRRRG